MNVYLTLSPRNPALIGLAALLLLGVFAWLFVTGRVFTGGGAAKVRRSVSLAVKSLWLHKLRSFLSVLGIIIGTSAVISLMAFGEGSMQDALADIKRQGATNIIVRSVKPPDDSATAGRSFVTTYGLTNKDLGRFETFGAAISRTVPIRVQPTEARYLERMSIARVIATVPGYADVNQLEMARGRFIVESDDKEVKNICVLGSEIADKLFPTEDPLNNSVLLRSMKFTVVGVVKERMPTGGSGGSQAAEEYNKDIYVPLKTSVARFGGIIFTRSSGSRSAEKVEISQVTLTVDAEVDSAEGRLKVQAVGDEIKRILEKDHYKRDTAVTVPLDRLEEAERAQKRFTNLLVLIASISLVVGGIGIMNIMLATVTERTREIGIRRALGAKRRDITLQFLVEAVVQTTVGGLCGVILGLGMVFTVPVVWNWIAGSPLPAVVHVPSIFLSLFVSVGVGVLFGWYPAQRAARLDPIEALRHD
ncbi:ABC transporter permease [Urbifossiella limnaea]|uniref:Macrolide export ATP-binding/permease protein MacB n=1 Tax=Urbifossiella limnaea TaxID=2528023 RepID=A0A517XXZ0_9BACT|nr:ABC transporter permease [Urbifossiella limnaea]QDU22370.1 Macrolide export ATP-binding/permease protein MacB [Urbifossiella limnaea]